MQAVFDQHVFARFPQLADLPAALEKDVLEQLQPLDVPAGTLMFDAGSPCQALPLILEGHIKVSKRGENGREIRLYSVNPGELCIVTVGCLLGGSPYAATGVAESPLQALTMPRALFLQLVHEHPAFRIWVFRLFTERISGLMQLVEEVAFHKLDQRLAAWLLHHAPEAMRSHQAIADELGSVREIISRLLRQFEAQGWVRLGRERVEILDPAGLGSLLNH